MITLCLVGYMFYMFGVMKLVDYIWVKYDSELAGGFVFMILTAVPFTLVLDYML